MRVVRDEAGEMSEPEHKHAESQVRRSDFIPCVIGSHRRVLSSGME